jgi:hypothetical protein
MSENGIPEFLKKASDLDGNKLDNLPKIFEFLQ